LNINGEQVQRKEQMNASCKNSRLAIHRFPEPLKKPHRKDAENTELAEKQKKKSLSSHLRSSIFSVLCASAVSFLIFSQVPGYAAPVTRLYPKLPRY
jgi:hypothetical protein